MQATRSRIGRLERTVSGGPKQIAFLVYGRTVADRERAIDQARADNTIRPGDLVIRGEWARAEEPPFPRWIAEGDDVRSDLDALSPQLVAVAESRNGQRPRASDRTTELMSAAELLAAALSSPLSA